MRTADQFISAQVRNRIKRAGISLPNQALTWNDVATLLFEKKGRGDPRVVRFLKEAANNPRDKEVLKEIMEKVDRVGRDKYYKFTKNVNVSYPEWKSKRLPGDGVLRSAAGEVRSSYGAIYKNILQKNPIALRAIQTPQGRKYIHDAVLKETGSYNKAIEAVRFLEQEALRSVTSISLSRAGESPNKGIDESVYGGGTRRKKVLEYSGALQSHKGQQHLPEARWWRPVSVESGAGTHKMMYGKFKGKTLNWIMQHKSYYIAFLDKHNIKDLPGYEKVERYLRVPSVQRFLGEYFDHRGEGSSPRDLQPYFDVRKGYTYTVKNGKRVKKPSYIKGGGYYRENHPDLHLSWKDRELYRQGGFGVSDSWEDSRKRIGVGRVTNKPAHWTADVDPFTSYVPQLAGAYGYAVFAAAPGGIFAPGQMGFVPDDYTSNWWNRKKEYRWDRPGADIEDAMAYGEALRRKELMDVIGRGYSGSYKTTGSARGTGQYVVGSQTGSSPFARLGKAIEMAPWMATGYQMRYEKFRDKFHKFMGMEEENRGLFGINDLLYEDNMWEAARAMEGQWTGVERRAARGKKVRGNKMADYADMGRGGGILGAGGDVLGEDFSFINMRVLERLGRKGTRQELETWHQAVASGPGWDVVQEVGLEHGIDVKEKFNEVWNKVLAR